jgi:hypothetical protein
MAFLDGGVGECSSWRWRSSHSGRPQDGSSPGRRQARPRSTSDDRERQTLEGQPAGQRWFGRRRASSRSASITSTTSRHRHHGDMRWPRRPRRVAWLTPPGQRPMPAPEPRWGRPVPSEPGFVLSPEAGALHRGGCRLGTGSHQRGRAPALTWCPGGFERGISSRSSTATRMHGCGGMGLGRSGRRDRAGAHLGHGLKESSGQRRTMSASECPGKRPGAMLRRRS